MIKFSVRNLRAHGWLWSAIFWGWFRFSALLPLSGVSGRSGCLPLLLGGICRSVLFGWQCFLLNTQLSRFFGTRCMGPVGLASVCVWCSCLFVFTEFPRAVSRAFFERCRGRTRASRSRRASVRCTQSLRIFSCDMRVSRAAAARPFLRNWGSLLGGVSWFPVRRRFQP